MAKTLEEVFKIVAAHLLKQNKAARDEENEYNGGCFYRLKVGEAVLSCAVGCLIPDARYKPEMEYNTVDGYSEGGQSLRLALLEEGILEDKSFIDEPKPAAHTKDTLMLGMLRELQILHDDSNPDVWPGALAKAAKAYDFKWPLEAP